MPSSFLNYAHSVLPYITLNCSGFENENDSNVKYYLLLRKRLSFVYGLLTFGVHVSRIMNDMV